MLCYLDTNIVIWLCQKLLNKITGPAIEAIESNDLLISPMVLLELQYLYEIGRIIQPAEALSGQLEAEIGLQVCPHPFPGIIRTSLLEVWTRDPFDRIIVAHARANRYAPLVTSDTHIHANYSKTVWL
jgi:PIN domain nuclease of toxin-antitoxin system